MNLKNIISRCDFKIDMIFGDFNINYHNESDSELLKQIMDNFGYIQIVKNATFVSAGSLLDHVYVRSDLLMHFRVKSIVTLRVFITLTMMQCKFALKNEKKYQL